MQVPIRYGIFRFAKKTRSARQTYTYMEYVSRSFDGDFRQLGTNVVSSLASISHPKRLADALCLIDYTLSKIHIFLTILYVLQHIHLHL
jgi:hypothetical protein